MAIKISKPEMRAHFRTAEAARQFAASNTAPYWWVVKDCVGDWEGFVTYHEAFEAYTHEVRRYLAALNAAEVYVDSPSRLQLDREV